MLQLGEQLLKQKFVCKVEYYQHQLALTAGDHRHTFQLLNDLLGKVQCPTMPSSSSEVELAPRFSASLMPKLTASEVRLTSL